LIRDCVQWHKSSSPASIIQAIGQLKKESRGDDAFS
jgi:hypothetical protein